MQPYSSRLFTLSTQNRTFARHNHAQRCLDRIYCTVVPKQSTRRIISIKPVHCRRPSQTQLRQKHSRRNHQVDPRDSTLSPSTLHSACPSHIARALSTVDCATVCPSCALIILCMPILLRSSSALAPRRYLNSLPLPSRVRLCWHSRPAADTAHHHSIKTQPIHQNRRTTAATYRRITDTPDTANTTLHKYTRKLRNPGTQTTHHRDTDTTDIANTAP